MTQAYNLSQLANNLNSTGQLDATDGLVNAVPATNGGTGQAAYAVGDLLYAPTTTTLNKLADVATGNALLSGGVGVAPAYGKIGMTTHVSGTLDVVNGGTGTATLASNNVLLGNGVGALQTIAPGTTGNVLTSNGTTWASVAALPTYSGPRGQVFTSGGTFTIPSGITSIKVTVVGGGGTGSAGQSLSGGAGGGGGGTSVQYFTGLTPGGTLIATVGAAGNTSSVSSGSVIITSVSATGGISPTAGSFIAGGAGGIGSGGVLNIGGSSGARSATASYPSVGGSGGNSSYGGGGTGGYGNGNPGEAGRTYGGGGGGGGYNNSGTASSGGAGAAGVVIFEY